MPIEILMPALSPTMEKGNLAKWLVKEGDAVKSGDVIAEIETDKATMEVEAVDEGTVGKILVPEGTADVAVNELIALLLEEGEDNSALAAAGAKSDAPRAAAAPQSQPSPASVTAKPAASQPAPSVQSVDTPKPVSVASTRSNGQDKGRRVFASPLARRIAKEKGIDLGVLSGSGPHGRIVMRDIDKAAREGVPARAAAEVPAAARAPTAPAPSMSDAQVRAIYEAGTYEEKPHDGMRKTIAKRLTESKQNVPHFYLTIDCELDALLRMRVQLNDAAPKDKDGKPSYKLSVNDFAIKAMALALQKVPEANATWTDTARLMHKHSDVGVAVAVTDGLFTPVIRKAETKTLSAISAEMKDLAGRARSKKLKPEEYQGGTTAVSNLGMFGIKDFSAVINPPHGSLLAIGAGEERAVVKKGRIVVANVMSVTLSCDHRAVDGALGAQLLQAFKELIENPVGMLV